MEKEEEFEDIKQLQKELNQYKKEKDTIKNIIGQIGGVQSRKRDKVVNIIFISLIVILFGCDAAKHLFHINTPIPSMFSLEIGVLLVSLKIIWMMHTQSKVDHFQFWILNSIEFRLNDIAKKVKDMSKKINK